MRREIGITVPYRKTTQTVVEEKLLLMQQRIAALEKRVAQLEKKK
jgi:hypothetical protein